jgi:hypothetical protein
MGVAFKKCNFIYILGAHNSYCFFPQDLLGISELFENIVACRAVTRQRPRGKLIHQSRYWVTRFANKTCSHGNDLSNVSTATNHQATTEELLETVFSIMLHAEEL